MPLTLYALSDGPPSWAVMQALKYLDLDYKYVSVNFAAGEQRTEEYEKKNPQKEIPVLDDDGFYLSESNAILQYLAEKYPKDETLYPKDPKARAIVNHRLCFNLSTYYQHVLQYAVYPIYFDYERTPLELKKMKNSLDVFNTYLQRLGTKYAAGDNVTIADFQLVATTMCLEVIDFDISDYPFVQTWYATYKKENPELWATSERGMKEMISYEKNPPDLSHMEHPFHPIRRDVNKKAQ